jgi:hypothetical protein
MTVCGYRPVTFASEIVGVEWAGAEARRAVEMAFADLQSADDRLPDVMLRVGIPRGSSTLTLFDGSRCVYRGVSVGACAHLLLHTALDSLIARSGGGIVVHAGLVGRGDSGVMLPGASGSGKTMLSAWLTLQGLTYFSDEACHVSERTMVADGFGRPLCFRGSWVEPLGLQADGNETAGNDGTSLVPARCLSRSRRSDAVVPRLVVFPNFQPHAGLTLTRLSPARTVARLLESVANWSNLSDHGVNQVTELARRVPAYQLTYGAFSQLDPLLALVEAID